MCIDISVVLGRAVKGTRVLQRGLTPPAARPAAPLMPRRPGSMPPAARPRAPSPAARVRVSAAGYPAAAGAAKPGAKAKLAGNADPAMAAAKRAPTPPLPARGRAPTPPVIPLH